MKKLFTGLLICFSLATTFGQEEVKKHKIDYSGFVRNDFFYDTRQSAEALEGAFPLYPLPKDIDYEGNDINDHGTINLLGISTRMRVKYTGLEVLGAQFSAFVEGDFTATSNSNSVRLRHAYTKFTWTKTNIMVGRYWHPMFVSKCFPTVLSLNTGVPFQTFSRSPQIRLTHKLSSNVTGILAIVYQSDSRSYGPSTSDDGKGISGRSAQYIRNAIVPNLHAQLQIESEKVLVGGAVDYKVLQPRLFTVDSLGHEYKTDEKIGTYAFMGYVKYHTANFTWKTKVMYGQNLYEHVLPGGYAVKSGSVDVETGHEEYTPYNHLYAFTNLYYNVNRMRYGLFLGYMKNQGTSDDIDKGRIYARSASLDKVYRIAPHIAYKQNKVTLGFEVEHTVASYGDIQVDGTVDNTYDVSNTRFLATITYDF